MAGSNLKFIIAAYALTWVVLLGYQWRLLRKGRRARSEYDRMAQQRGGEMGQ